MSTKAINDRATTRAKPDLLLWSVLLRACIFVRDIRYLPTLHISQLYQFVPKKKSRDGKITPLMQLLGLPCEQAWPPELLH